tara:strand:+ start:166 stop:2451 length:2286 start_codon:yes stop_codon:yes gene_type:complete
MKNKVIALLTLGCFLIADSADKIAEKNSIKKVTENNQISSFKERGPARTLSRDTDFVYWKVDSSKNGYGAFLETNSPLAYSYDEAGGGDDAGWVAVYRQWGTLEETAGFLGVAQSDPYGEQWFVESRINTTYPENQTYTIANPGLPTANGAPQARYPSGVVSSYHNKATAVWNEYTTPAYGGGGYGGVPMYSYDFFGVGENSNFASISHINEGCVNLNTAQGEVCDPPDLWNGNVQMVDGSDGSVRLLAAFTSWDPIENYSRYMIRSLNVTNGYISVDAAEFWQQDSLDQDDMGNCLWYECSGYTGSPDFHVNSDGVGYMAVTSYSADSDTEPPFSHTLFFKKTEDYGQTWSSDGGYKNSGYHYISDAVLDELSDSLLTMWSLDPDTYADRPWYPWAVDSYGDVVGDTINFSDDSANFYYTPGLFLGYSYDIMTDHDGGIHFVASTGNYICKDENFGCEDGDGDGAADSIYFEIRFPGAGMYHFYNPDPVDDPDNWSATLIQSFYDAWSADWPTTGNLVMGSDAWFYFYPSIRPSYEDGSQVLWFGASNMSSASYNADSTLYEPRDIDLYMAKSVDNGKTWWGKCVDDDGATYDCQDPENITNTVNQLEVGMHLANIGSDYDMGVFCQVPNFDVETYPPAASYEDYMNYVYIGRYENDMESLSTDGGGEKEILPAQFVLQQNYPNPFNPVTKISYSIDKGAEVNLKLYDVRGGLVETLLSKRVQAGSHDHVLNASHLSSGVYFYTMTVNDVSQTKKLILMK